MLHTRSKDCNAQMRIFHSDDGESFEVACLRLQIGRSGGETDEYSGRGDDGIVCGLSLLVCRTDWSQGVHMG